MSYEPLLSVHRVLPTGGAGTFTREESRAILEVAFLATEADDVLAEEEIIAFRELATHLAVLAGQPAPTSEAEIANLRDRFAQFNDHTERPARLKVLASVLARPVAKETAYKVALAVGMCDFSSSAAEGDFEEELLEALGIGADEADRLASQVYDVIGEDDEEEDDELDDDEDDEDDEELDESDVDENEDDDTDEEDADTEENA